MITANDTDFLRRVAADARLWAVEFVGRFTGGVVGERSTVDSDLMTGWFANAIEAGRGAGVAAAGVPTSNELDGGMLPALTIRMIPADSTAPSLTAEWAVIDPLIGEDVPKIAARLYAVVDATRRVARRQRAQHENLRAAIAALADRYAAKECALGPAEIAVTLRALLAT